MMEHIPFEINIVFIAISIITLAFFYLSAKKSNITLWIISGWIALHSIVALTGFYTKTDAIPPRIVAVGLPVLMVSLSLLLTTSGKKYLSNLNPAILTLMHTVRVPVEIVLYLLAAYKTIPELMTFDGRNPDILSGLTAPFIYYFGYVKKQISAKWLLIWNIACLILLFNIVTQAILSAPFPFQQLAFDQPNIAVLYFPFILLPALVVPLVLVAHISVIYGLAIKTKYATK